MRIYWYCPKTMFTVFEREEDNPSYRLRCLLTHQKLLREGHFSAIVDDPAKIQDPDVVVLMSFGEVELELARWVKSLGKHVVHDYSENIRGIPILEETKQLCTYIVCCSTALGSLESKMYPEKVKVVKDPIENSPVMHNPNYSRDKLKVAWMGMGGNAHIAEILKPIVQDLDMEFVEISDRHEASIRWHRDTWRYALASCDIALCPQIHWNFPAKSNVKVTTAIGLGLAVVASPIQSYTEIIQSGYNGYICNDLEDWSTALHHLKSDDLRKLMVARSKDIIPFYSEEYIYKEWERVFALCLRSK